MAPFPPRNHNGGPPLEDPVHVPEWGRRGVGVYFHWKKANRRFKRSMPMELKIRQDDKAEKLGLTYDEYSAEVIERGRYLQESDLMQIAAIKARRRKR